MLRHARRPGAAVRLWRKAALPRTAVVAFALAAAAVPPTAAAPPTALASPGATVTNVAPCDIPEIHRLDFWVGDWLVYDADHHNQLVAVEHVEKHSKGCIIQENLTLITDLYRRPGVDYRLTGIGVNRFDGERWLQLWADNQWGAIAMAGNFDAKGDLVYTSIIPSRGRDLKIVYQKNADGSVRTLQYVAPTGSNKYEKYGDLIYRPNR